VVAASPNCKHRACDPEGSVRQEAKKHGVKLFPAAGTLEISAKVKPPQYLNRHAPIT
jgi:hypothetical protein